MRKIEQLMNTAIKNSTDWRMSNTEVVNDDNGVSTCLLYTSDAADE